MMIDENLNEIASHDDVQKEHLSPENNNEKVTLKDIKDKIDYVQAQTNSLFSLLSSYESDNELSDELSEVFEKITECINYQWEYEFILDEFV